ncbi:hypothetical protein SADUNF_Sadunf08G0085300 [Salix dunnii]|uniref:Uncharacterized protein n=1 Tax=Salix dunnii TaxID=1413687 RepID=A0A835JTH3_9ROSI|nr:hypothetical protein SADUNF_Sadunf08G0085300 [Salix dunnii]
MLVILLLLWHASGNDRANTRRSQGQLLLVGGREFFEKLHSKVHAPDWKRARIGNHGRAQGALRACTLYRTPNLEASLDDCLTAVKEMEHMEHVRACYDEEESSFANDEFLQMILVNGCLIFETFLKYSITSLRRRNDPVFVTPGMLFDLRSNMMLLENQIH